MLIVRGLWLVVGFCCSALVCCHWCFGYIQMCNGAAPSVLVAQLGFIVWELSIRLFESYPFGRLEQLFDFFRMMSFYFTTVGNYFCTMVCYLCHLELWISAMLWALIEISVGICCCRIGMLVFEDNVNCLLVYYFFVSCICEQKILIFWEGKHLISDFLVN